MESQSICVLWVADLTQHKGFKPCLQCFCASIVLLALVWFSVLRQGLALWFWLSWSSYGDCTSLELRAALCIRHSGIKGVCCHAWRIVLLFEAGMWHLHIFHLFNHLLRRHWLLLPLALWVRPLWPYEPCKSVNSCLCSCLQLSWVKNEHTVFGWNTECRILIV